MEKTQINNIELVDTYFKAIQNGNMEVLASLVDESVVWHQPGNNKFSGVHHGADSVFALVGGMMEISNGTFKIEKVNIIMANESRVAAMVTFSGQRNNISMSMNGVDILTINQGKITEAWLYSGDQDAEDAFWGKD